MEAIFKRGISCLCSLALVTSLVPVTAWADDPAQAPAPVVLEDRSEILTAETSARVLEALAAPARAVENPVTLKPGSHERWIGRINAPAYALRFYEVLEEAVDGDGLEDYLIEDDYIQGTAESKGSYQNNDGSPRLVVGPIRLPASSTSEEVSQKLTELFAYATATVAAFDRDHPEVFWLGNQWQIVTSPRLSGDGSYELTGYLSLQWENDGVPVEVRSQSYLSETAVHADMRQRDQVVETVVAGCPSNASTRDVLAYFNRWLTHNNEYNTSVDLDALAESGTCPQAWECISALKGQEGETGPVCEAYSRAFMLLCKKVGIPCVLVDGWGANFGSAGPHMWNNVRVDGVWYAVDVTWNDPAGGNTGKVSGGESEEWFLLGEDSPVLFDSYPFSQTHRVRNLVFPIGPMFTNGPVLSKQAYGYVAPRPPAPETGGSSSGSSASEPKPSPTPGAMTPATPSRPQNTAGVLAKKPSVPKAKITKAKSIKKKTATVQWKRLRGKVSGYQVQMALSKKFKKGLKKLTVKKAKTTKATLKKLKSKKTYYVRIRAYYKTGGKTYYGKWSAVKKVRVK